MYSESSRFLLNLDWKLQLNSWSIQNKSYFPTKYHNQLEIHCFCNAPRSKICDFLIKLLQNLDLCIYDFMLYYCLKTRTKNNSLIKTSMNRNNIPTNINHKPYCNWFTSAAAPWKCEIFCSLERNKELLLNKVLENHPCLSSGVWEVKIQHGLIEKNCSDIENN